MNSIELSLFTAKLNAICEEMGAVLRRTAFSPNIKDRLDYSCAIFDPDGLLCAQAAHIPVHLGSMTFAMAGIVKSMSWQPGDMIVMNDPFQGGTHLPDVTLIAPVFIQEKLIGFVANRAHHADIGCESPGSMPLSNTLQEEGLIIPATKILINGEIDHDVLEKILAELIDPIIARGDFLAQISANRCGIARFIKLSESLSSLAALSQGLEELNHYAEKAANMLITSLPDGKYCFTDYLDDDGSGEEKLPISLSLEIYGDRMILDFTGSNQQTSGNLNCPLSVTAAAVYYVFYCLLPDEIPSCDGCFRALSIQAEEGTLINASFPAAVAAGNVETSTRIVDCMLGALRQAIPDLIPSASHGSMNNIAMGSQHWAYYETIGGGMGANKQAAGYSAIQTHMTNSLNTPIEVLEMNYPLRIDRYAIRRDSGGKGDNQGGDGLCRAFHFLAPAKATLLTERRTQTTWGSSDQNEGKSGVNLLNGSPIPAKCAVELKAGDQIEVRTPGGGAWSESS